MSYCEHLILSILFACILETYVALGHAVPFSRQGDSFECTVKFDISPPEEPGAADFLRTVVTLLETQKKGEAVDANLFNRSDDGLAQYYQSLAYDYHHETNRPEVLIESWLDPICMPNVSSNVSDDFEFFKVKVFGFPAFKKNAKAYMEVEPSSYAKDVNIHLNGTSDVTIFSGYFKTGNETFHFVYHTYDNVYHSTLTKMRTANALVKPKLAKYEFSFESEVFIHTCDSTHERFADVNATLFAKFQLALQKSYLPKLAVIADAKFLDSYDAGTLALGKAYRAKLVPAIVRAADQFLRLKVYFKGEFTPLTYVRLGKKQDIMYRTVFDGLLNYSGWELSNASTIAADGPILSMLNKLTVFYPETGEKQGTITVITSDIKKGQIQQKFVIQSIAISVAYKANVSTFPVHVYRDLEKWMFTKSGFYARIEVYQPQDFYDFAIRHAGKEIAMAMGWKELKPSVSST